VLEFDDPEKFTLCPVHAIKGLTVTEDDGMANTCTEWMIEAVLSELLLHAFSSW
jgi:hypothetical protein